jgi:hypothetical protein
LFYFQTKEESMEKHISRRKFLKGALVTGASAAVTATALGGCVPQERSQEAANGDAAGLRQWSWTVKPSPTPGSDQSIHGAPVNTGDGFKMAMRAGAGMDSAPHCIMMHFDPTWLPEGGAPFSGSPWLRVNLRGERFANENLGYQSVVTSVRLQPEQYAFQICDSRWAEHVHDHKHPNSHGRSTAALCYFLSSGEWQGAYVVLGENGENALDEKGDSGLD